MKKGVNQWCFPEQLGLRECMKLAKEAEFEGIELVLGESKEESRRIPWEFQLGVKFFDEYQNLELTTTSSEEDIKNIAKMATDIGIKVTSIASILPFHYPLTSGSPEVREKGKLVIRKAIQIASILGADTVLLIPGVVTEKVSYDTAYRRAQESIKELGEIAEKYNVYLAMENVWNKFLLTPLEYRNFIDEINCNYVGAYFDVGNVLIFGFPEQWIRILGKRIKKVHFDDFNQAIGNINGFANLLRGDVNWPAVMQSLKEIGYDDYLIAELPPPYTYYPERLICEASTAMDSIIGK